MTIKHVKTEMGMTPTSQIISMRFANDPDAAKATAVVEIKVPFEQLNLAEVPDGHLQPGSYPHTRFQIAALRYVRDGLNAEIERLANPQGH